MKRLLHTLGFVLASASLLTLLVHKPHLDTSSSSESSSHCCVCQTVGHSTAPSINSLQPLTYYTQTVAIRLPLRMERDAYTLDSPRGPPAA